MLELDHFTTGYRAGVPVVHEITLTLEAGSARGLIGRNGAGKTCLAEGLIGRHPAMHGRVRLNDLDLTKATPRTRVRSGISLVPEGRLVFGQLTVRENLEMAVFGAGRRLTRERLAQVEGIFPTLGRKRQAAAATMSGGEQQWLAIARAMVQEPTVIVLDEPSLGLAPVAVEALTAALKDVRDLGVSLLLMEQNPHILEQLCDEVNLLDQGRVGARVDLASAAGTEIVERAYLGA
jgi:ABC-type branched-subunit amino acid transport system ATPase component